MRPGALDPASRLPILPIRAQRRGPPRLPRMIRRSRHLALGALRRSGLSHDLAARYAPAVKTIWTGRVAQVTAKYGENAPTAAVCCNACRTCVQTNLIGLALGAFAAVGAAVTGRFAKPS